MTPGTMGLKAIDRRTRAAGYMDGLVELLAAAVLIVMALAWMIGPVLVGIAAAPIAIYGWRVGSHVKEKVTYPRIGYSGDASEPPPPTARGVLVFIGVGVALMAGAVIIFGDPGNTADWRRVLPLLSGLLISAGFWFAGQRSGLLRHRLLAAASVGTGIVFWALGSGAGYVPVALQLATTGALAAVFGLVALVVFVRRHPVMDVSDHG